MHTHRHPDHSGDSHRHSETSDTGASGMVELLDLDAEVLHDHLMEVTGWIRELTIDNPPHSIVDLGAGTGTGTFALLDRFPAAHAVAVDMSAEMLQHLVNRAAALDLTARIRTVEADVDAAWPDLGSIDLVWASASLHHLADPDRVLSDVFDALNPGGVLAVVELDSFPRFLPDDIGIGKPGLEARAHEALDEARAADLPTLGSDWGVRLSQAGFGIEAERSFTIELTKPLPPATSRYAEVSLRRMRSNLDTRLDTEDLAALDRLLERTDGLGIRYRDDLSVRAMRSAWVARRPCT